MDCTPPTPTRLKWDFTNVELVKNIDTAYQDASKVAKVGI
jgi:hypothetical protein